MKLIEHRTHLASLVMYMATAILLLLNLVWWLEDWKPGWRLGAAAFALMIVYIAAAAVKFFVLPLQRQKDQHDKTDEGGMSDER